MFLRIGLLYLVSTAVIFASPAFAEMGQAPVSKGIYVSVEGGYLRQDAESVLGHGISADGVDVADTSVEAENGYFAGISIGAALAPRSLLGTFDRIEASFSFGKITEDESDTRLAPGFTSLTSVDGLTTFTFRDFGDSEYERKTYDGALALKRDIGTGVTLSLEPFVRVTDEDIKSTVSTSNPVDTAWRQSDISSRYYGALLALEPEVAITPSTSLVARVGAGVYGYDFDADFESGGDPFFAAKGSDDKNGVGFRGTLGVGVKVKAWEGASVTAFGSADYWSDTQVAVLPTNDPNILGDAARIDTDDLWDLRAGVRLTVGLDRSPETLK